MRRRRRPGIHSPDWWLWIPGSRYARPGMTIDLYAHALNRHRVDLVFPAHELDMRAHGGGGSELVAAHDGNDDAVVLGLRFGETPEVAELRAAERLHAH